MRDRLKELLHELANMQLIGKSIEEGVDFLVAKGVIAPPCKVGDKIHQTDGIRIYESTINDVTYTTNKVIYCTENICFDETAIGKSIFLTKEEAERALEGADNGKKQVL